MTKNTYGSRIITEIKRPDPTWLEALGGFTTPDICDACRIYDCMDPDLKPWVTQKKLIGPAITVKVPVGEGDIVVKAIDLAEKGDIIVIAGHGNVRSSYWGDKRSARAKARGVAGVIIDGAFRDVEDCEAVGLPIYAKGLTAGTALKTGRGEINVPVSCGGTVVNPGDIIVADRNGVCVIPLDYAQEILKLLEPYRPNNV